jgi:hypothetical protein
LPVELAAVAIWLAAAVQVVFVQQLQQQEAVVRLKHLFL